VAGIRSSFEVRVNDEFGRAVRSGPHTLKARVLVCPNHERVPDWTAPIQWSQKTPLPIKASQVIHSLSLFDCLFVLFVCLCVCVFVCLCVYLLLCCCLALAWAVAVASLLPYFLSTFSWFVVGGDCMR
jgi:hypothetical protein